MRFKLIHILLFLTTYCAIAQQDTLQYKEYLDYYGAHAKSTVLSGNLDFLKDGDYVFKGSVEDFRFLLDKKIRIEQEKLLKIDTLYMSGTIKDSVKIRQWTILFKDPKTKKLTNIVPKNDYIIQQLNYKETGKSLIIFKRINKINHTVTYSDDEIYTHFYYERDNTRGYKYLMESEEFTFFKNKNTIKYYRNLEIKCDSNYELKVSRKSENLNQNLKTSILVVTNSKEKMWLVSDETFKDGKLIKISFHFSTNASESDRKLIRLNNVMYQYYLEDYPQYSKIN